MGYLVPFIYLLYRLLPLKRWKLWGEDTFNQYLHPVVEPTIVTLPSLSLSLFSPKENNHTQENSCWFWSGILTHRTFCNSIMGSWSHRHCWSFFFSINILIYCCMRLWNKPEMITLFSKNKPFLNLYIYIRQWPQVCVDISSKSFMNAWTTSRFSKISLSLIAWPVIVTPCACI